MAKDERAAALAKAKRKCTVKQQLFSEYYAECLNGTQAARLAGYKGNDAALSVVGSQNIRKSKVRAYVDELLAAKKLSAPEVLARISDHAAGSMEDFLETGDMQGFNTINLRRAGAAGKLHLLKSVKISRTLQGGSISIELYDSQAALDKLMKHYGQYQERVDLTSGGEVLDLEVWQKARAERLADVEGIDNNE